MTQDQKDFIGAIRTVSDSLAEYIEQRLEEGATFDEVQTQLRRVVALAGRWRIGRGV